MSKIDKKRQKDIREFYKHIEDYEADITEYLFEINMVLEDNERNLDNYIKLNVAEVSGIQKLNRKFLVMSLKRDIKKTDKLILERLNLGVIEDYKKEIYSHKDYFSDKQLEMKLDKITEFENKHSKLFEKYNKFYDKYKSNIQ